MMGSQQHFAEKASLGGDANSWLPSISNSSTSVVPTSSPVSGSTPSVAGDVGPAFCNDVVEMMSLVQFLIDKNPRSSFTRRGHMIYTKTPSKDPHAKMTGDCRGRTAKKHKGQCNVNAAASSQEGCSHCFSLCTPSDLTAERDGELVSLRDQVEDLKRKLEDKDELLKQLETTKNHTVSMQSKLDEMTLSVEKKDSIIKSIQSQLTNAKMEAADKQAKFEKMEWEWESSKSKMEKLEEEVGSAQGEISSMNTFFLDLSSSAMASSSPSYMEQDDYEAAEDGFSPIDGWDERNVEEAMGTYLSAISALKENQDDSGRGDGGGRMADAVAARLYLHSLLFSSK